MFTNLIAVVIGASLLVVGFVSPAAGQTEMIRKVDERTEKFRQEVKALGVGENVLVRIEVFNGKVYRGYIRETDESSVTVVDKKGVASQIQYAQIKDVTRKAKTNKTVAGIVLGAAAGAAILLLVTYKRVGG